MPRLTWIPVCLAVLLSAACAGGGASRLNAADAADDARYPVQKQIRYSFTLTNSTGSLLEKPKFWTYLPIPVTSHQKVKKVTANYPYHEQRDDLGNSVIHFDLQDIPPYGARIVTITVDLLMSDRPVPMPAGDRARFLSREPFIESDDGKITSLAAQLHVESPADTARNDYEWVEKNIKSESYVAEDRGALYAVETHKGDCTEFAYLLTALYRAQQIPARAMGGYAFGGNGVMKPTDYHNWSEFYLDGAWHVADAQKGAFADSQTDYVGMRVIATGGQAAVASQRFSFAGEGLRVEMN